MNSRRSFIAQLAGVGLFSILPGAGRIWKAERVSAIGTYTFRSPSFELTIQDLLKYTQTSFEIAKLQDMNRQRFISMYETHHNNCHQ